MPDSLSVLVCTYNRPALLEKSLRALLETSTEKPDEVVVVNGGSDDADEVVRSFGSPPGVAVKLLKIVNINLAASRNAGLAHCTSRIVAFTDDDAQVFPDWVSQMKRVQHEHPEAGAVGGAVVGTNSNLLLGRVADLITFRNWEHSQSVRNLPGVNVSYKRAVLDRVGWLDEALFGGEDVDFNWRVKQAGFEVYFDPAIRVYHHHRSTLRGFLSQHYYYGRQYYRVRRKWPEMYCIYPHQFRRGRDYLKAANALAGMFYLPVAGARRLSSRRDWVMGACLIFAAGAVWRVGMVAQRFRDRAHGLGST